MRLPKPAIQHIVILNFAIAILKVRTMDDVVSKAVNITKDKKILNQKRKLIAKIDSKIEEIMELTDIVFSQMSDSDLERVRKGHSAHLVQSIPETTSNPETLALFMLYINFQSVPDPRMNKILDKVKEIDYIGLIYEIEEVGLQKNVGEDMYLLADDLVEQIKK